MHTILASAGTTPTATATSGSNPDPHEILFPAYTDDYYLVQGACGLGLAANRNIQKGKFVFQDSYEFLFADVQDGDQLRFERHEEASSLNPDRPPLPSHFPLTREVLTDTHGVQLLKPSPNKNFAGIITWTLETPGMMLNHSCDPNLCDDSHDEMYGETIALKQIKKGEEMTYDYACQYYDSWEVYEKCLCGSKNCRGRMMGFKDLPAEEQRRLWPFTSDAVKTMHRADTGEGLPVIETETMFPPRVAPRDKKALRLVVPGPSHACANVLVRQNEETGKYQLIAGKDFQMGDLVYEFWMQEWPMGGSTPIDMIFSSNLMEGDPEEGTVVRVNPLECAKRNCMGELMFSSWDMFAQHSCNPNLVYQKQLAANEDEDWHATYATRTIYKGEVLTIDMNTLLWDRTAWEGIGDGVCNCGAQNCKGTIKGFRFLSPQVQEEMSSWSWQRVPLPHHKGGGKHSRVGEALSPHVQACWKRHGGNHAQLSDSATSSTCCSSEEEISDHDAP